ncbi:MFS transporter [Halobacteriaceae archaeon SHR40]|uniref:MFS transporter n=1 Tax=Halovenus amylolytica TaxID=2500550 RepID=UPI000FE4175D
MVWSTKRSVLAACTMAFFATMVARLAISPVVPAISAEFGVSNAVIGLALSGMWLAYALAQFPSGLVGDRIGERLVILVAVGGTAVASLLLAVSPFFWTFLLFTVVLGGAAGLHYSVATTLLSRTFENTGTAVGIHSAGAPVAGLVAPVGAAYVGTFFGWRYAVALGVVAAVPTVFLVAYGIPSVAPQHPQKPIRDRVNSGILLDLLSRPPIAGTVVISVLAAFVWQGTASFLPTFLVEHRSYSETTAGIVFSGYFVAQGIGQPGIGWLSDRIGRDRAMGLCMASGIVGYTLYVAGPGLGAVAAATVLVGVAMSWGSAMLPKVLDNMSTQEEGLGFGLVRTTYMVVGASGSVGVGALADLFGWATAFLVLAGIQGAILLALLGASARRQLKSMHKDEHRADPSTD